MNEPLRIEHHAAASRFEACVDGQLGVCVYRQIGQTLHMVHTEVPAALQGRGIAAALVQEALEWARAQGLKVRPLCSYVALYMRRHPQTQDLLEPAFPGAGMPRCAKAGQDSGPRLE
jgi:uncharacterized protein